MRQDSSNDNERQIPSMARFVIGLVVGVIAVILGLFFLTEPAWLRILVLILGGIQLVTSAFQYAQITRAKSED